MFESNCKFDNKPTVSYIVGGLLILGVFISWFPQHFKIIRYKTSQGISWLTIFLGNLSTINNTINVIMEQWNTLICCPSFGFWKCNGALLSILSNSIWLVK